MTSQQTARLIYWQTVQRNAFRKAESEPRRRTHWQDLAALAYASLAREREGKSDDLFFALADVVRKQK